MNDDVQSDLPEKIRALLHGVPVFTETKLAHAIRGAVNDAQNTEVLSHVQIQKVHGRALQCRFDDALIEELNRIPGERRARRMAKLFKSLQDAVKRQGYPNSWLISYPKSWIQGMQPLEHGRNVPSVYHWAEYAAQHGHDALLIDGRYFALSDNSDHEVPDPKALMSLKDGEFMIVFSPKDVLQDQEKTAFKNKIKKDVKAGEAFAEQHLDKLVKQCIDSMPGSEKWSANYDHISNEKYVAQRYHIDSDEETVRSLTHYLAKAGKPNYKPVLFAYLYENTRQKMEPNFSKALNAVISARVAEEMIQPHMQSIKEKFDALIEKARVEFPTRQV